MKPGILLPILGLPSLSLALPTLNNKPEDACSHAQWGKLMFQTRKPPSPLPLPPKLPHLTSPPKAIAAFEHARTAKKPSCFNWTSDGCTMSPDKPSGFNFLPACHRHDFGDTYLTSRGEWTQANKDRVDDRFRDDMLDVCEGYEGFAKESCRGWAGLYRDTTGWWNGARNST